MTGKEFKPHLAIRALERQCPQAPVFKDKEGNIDL